MQKIKRDMNNLNTIWTVDDTDSLPKNNSFDSIVSTKLDIRER